MSRADKSDAVDRDVLILLASGTADLCFSLMELLPILAFVQLLLQVNHEQDTFVYSNNFGHGPRSEEQTAWS